MSRSEMQARSPRFGITLGGLLLCASCSSPVHYVTDAGTSEDADTANAPADTDDADTQADNLGRCASVTAPLRSTTYVTDAVDLLFVVDNSGSMSEEQRKLAEALPQLVRVLTSGNRSGEPSPEGESPEFPPAKSLHLAVVTTDMGVNGAPPQNSCGERSFVPSDPDPLMSSLRLNKPLGDDGVFQIDTEVAVAGLWRYARPEPGLVEVVPGDESCGDLSFPEGVRFLRYEEGETELDTLVHDFSCVAKRGRNGCGLEQPLEAALKALTPPDSALRFSQGTRGQGSALDPSEESGPNDGFLRPEAILAVVFVGDEDDCSIPDENNAMFDANSTAIQGEINVRCALEENQHYLYDLNERYVEGLRALKPSEYQDRIIIGVVAGAPLSEESGALVHSGEDEIDALLARADMQISVRRNQLNTADELVPTCIGPSGDGYAAPSRRLVTLAKAFGDNGLVASICEDEFFAPVKTLVDKTAAQLSRTCAD